ncbi:ThiF family adenylyltransferase [Celeribacter halophilus]|uniref:ThiF family adenylyltransferase n=1 Tax=Celeribacter halophilus TaxID=576117 RepID=UPI001C087AD5|nr:ThiF family adenylyltransferase [Celeribacter halophilus]MBU2888242.1 ThiF family adenylyltransferase [Celeribacter halophilus]MDO6512286.1 ThiF family adenylyltransferase [Celeribacter halophilus]
MSWWFTRSTRLSSEKAAIADLEAGVDWLQVGRWQTNSDLAMCVVFRIVTGDDEFAFEMIYPSVFPDAPPMIYTQDRSLVSGHQYGAEGELCLEHRPDNWLPTITGADMIASCQRLLSEERPEQGALVHARSAHIASLGRDMRSHYCRLLLTPGDLEALNTLSEYTPQPLILNDRKAASSLISSIVSVGQKDTPFWVSDLLIPKGGLEENGFVVRVPGAGKQGDISADDLKALLEGVRLAELGNTVLESDGHEHLLIGDAADWELFWIYGEAGKRKVINYTTLPIPEPKPRLPGSHASLFGKKVGIVGCGSVGSKIATSLCRSGVGEFFLIDEDIFFPGNIVRNELDLNDIGSHKAYALRDRLLRINPRIDVKALRISLGGQESANSMAGALEALGKCDLLVDATADPSAFNMIASVSTRQRKPMIWTEVLAGGIGGIVARSRPDIDAVPLAARSQIEIWCNDQGMEWARTAGTDPYGNRGSDGTPLIAEDAEVAIMAAHAARYATDILTRPDASIFPMSAYVIGFSSEWLFNEPFDTRPIDLQPIGTWGETADLLEPDALLQLLKDHLPDKETADATVSAG